MRTLTVSAVLLLVAAAWGADPNPLIVVSAASASAGITADSLASIYGDNISTITKAADSVPWPTSLGDMPGVTVLDAANKSFAAGIIFVSPSQMNIWIPAGVAAGPATISFPFTGLGIGVGTAALRIVPVTIQKVAPALFSADGSGSGVAAATGVRVLISGPLQSPVPVFTCDSHDVCTSLPIDPGIDAPVYLTFYGTGIRGHSSTSNVVVRMGGTTVLPTYAGAQPQFPGLDQVNVPLPLSLHGSGIVKLTVSVDGITSNPVEIRVQ